MNKKQINEAVVAGLYVKYNPDHKLSSIFKIRYLNNEYFKMGRCIDLFLVAKQVPTMAEARPVFDRIRQRNSLETKDTSQHANTHTT